MTSAAQVGELFLAVGSSFSKLGDMTMKLHNSDYKISQKDSRKTKRNAVGTSSSSTFDSATLPNPSGTAVLSSVTSPNALDTAVQCTAPLGTAVQSSVSSLDAAADSLGQTTFPLPSLPSISTALSPHPHVTTSPASRAATAVTAPYDDIGTSTTSCLGRARSSSATQMFDLIEPPCKIEIHGRDTPSPAKSLKISPSVLENEESSVLVDDPVKLIAVEDSFEESAPLFTEKS